jgi:putative heme-binding domain-containing protein
VMEHCLILAAQKMNLLAVSLDDLKAEKNTRALRRMLMSFLPDDGSSANLAMNIAKEHLASDDSALARTALKQVTDHLDADEWIAPDLSKWLDAKETSDRQIIALEGFCSALITKPETQKLLAKMLAHNATDVRLAALRVIASQKEAASSESWMTPIEKMLASDNAPKPLVIDAIKKLKSPRFDPALTAIASDATQPQSLRLKALDAMSKRQLEGGSFEMVSSVLADAASSSAAKIQAAGMIASSPLKKEALLTLAPLFSSLGPVELKSLLPVVRKSKDADFGRAVAASLAKNPVIAGLQESLYRTAFSDLPPDLFESIIHPAYAKAAEAIEEKKRQLGPLAERVASNGRADAGKKHFEIGKGTCVACHKIGSLGRPIGPDLSKIGAIRTERDLIESILFPSNTLARDYETHVIEMKGGETIAGVIRSHTAEGLLVADIAGQEKNLPHLEIVSDTTLTTSLMPMGLDQTMPEQELLDLVAYLRSLK